MTAPELLQDLTPQEVTDDRGTYLVYPGKECAVCGLALTSRNRAPKRNLCMRDDRERCRIKAQERRLRRPAGAPLSGTLLKTPSVRPTPIPKEAFELDPYRQKVHSALSYWLTAQSDGARRDLDREMGNWELNARLKAAKALMPPMPLPPDHVSFTDSRPTPLRVTNPVPSFEAWLSEPSAFDEDTTDRMAQLRQERTL